jgi:hypothetical protein
MSQEKHKKQTILLLFKQPMLFFVRVQRFSVKMEAHAMIWTMSSRTAIMVLLATALSVSLASFARHVSFYLTNKQY